jgi:hypothetical protein
MRHPCGPSCGRARRDFRQAGDLFLKISRSLREDFPISIRRLPREDYAFRRKSTATGRASVGVLRLGSTTVSSCCPKTFLFPISTRRSPREDYASQNSLSNLSQMFPKSGSKLSADSRQIALTSHWFSVVPNICQVLDSSPSQHSCSKFDGRDVDENLRRFRRESSGFIGRDDMIQC